MRLEGWHIIILLGLVVALAVLVGIALLVTGARRGAGTGDGTATRPPDTAAAPAPAGKEQRLQELDDLLRRQVIREDEYSEARQRIIDS